ncbi:MAG: ComF family protein [Coriobacteriia bacterium]|nr:ComF family protein [Coriobacteriia bacterium]
MAEVAWTTRCIICDTPGKTLCDSCMVRLPYIDRWLACPRCGAPHGLRQCVECNTLSLAEIDRANPPFARCVSVIEHRGPARGIVTGFKDGGEQRLGIHIARLMDRAIPPSWKTADALTYVPPDRRALRRRGFDHMAIVASELSRLMGLPVRPLLHKLPTSDQRGLERRERFVNMEGAIRALPPAPDMPAPRRVVLIDDVYTTGATLFAACDALHEAGIQEIRCATFARVP